MRKQVDYGDEEPSWRHALTCNPQYNAKENNKLFLAEEHIRRVGDMLYGRVGALIHWLALRGQVVCL